MKLIDNHLVSEMMERALSSDRKRTSHNLHQSGADPIQRYCTAAEFAPWAPKEETPEAKEYVAELLNFTGHE